MAVDPAHKLCQLCGILRRIVYARHQTVLKRDAPAGLFKIVTAGIDRFLNVIFVRHRHQLQALFLVGCMKRERQRDLQLFIRKLPHARNDPAGGDRQVPLADIESVFIAQQFDEF